MDALPLVEVQTVLSCMWEAAGWLWHPQESTEGPGHGQVLPYGDRDSHTVCCLNYLSTSQTVLDQLDVPHRRLFHVILTQKYACDIRVIRMLRERMLSNSPTRLVKQLRENHG